MNQDVILVDPYDNPVGVSDKQTAHQKGLQHRAFSIFMFDCPKNPMYLLLQRRCPSKYHSGGLWSNTCCSHPGPNETVLSSAKRRLKEEMGLIAVNLHIKGKFNYYAGFANNLIENEVDYVLACYHDNQPIAPNPLEVEAVAWINIDMLKQDLSYYPDKYTVWLPEALDIAIKP